MHLHAGQENNTHAHTHTRPCSKATVIKQDGRKQQEENSFPFVTSTHMPSSATTSGHPSIPMTSLSEIPVWTTGERYVSLH